MRMISFPTDPNIGPKGLGELFIRPSASTLPRDWQFIGWARGEVHIPDGYDLRLDIPLLRFRYSYIKSITAQAVDEDEKQRIIENYTESFRQAFSSINPNDIQSLMLSGPWDDNLIAQVGRLSSLYELSFNSPRSLSEPITDETLRHLEGLVNLRDLDLRSADITDKGFASLAKIKSLKSLAICSEGITGEGFVALKNSSIEELDIGQVNLSPAGCQRLGSLHSLRKLTWHSVATDTGLAALEPLSNLREITLDNAPITDEGLKHLSALKELASISANQTAVTDAGVSQLLSLPHLSSLSLSNTKVTNATVANLSKLPTLRNIKINGGMLNDEAGQYLAKMQHLEELAIRPCSWAEGIYMNEHTESDYAGETAVGDKGYACLKSMPSLRILDLQETPITDKTLEYLHDHPSLIELWATYNNITGKGLGNMPRLRLLHLGRTQLTDEALETISTCTDLEELYIWTTPITDAGVARLVNLRKLRHLSLGGTKVTDAGIASLADMHDLEELIITDLDLSNASLTTITAMPRLWKLYLSWQQFSLHDLAKLRESRSLKYIRMSGMHSVTDKIAAISELQEVLPLCRIIGY